MEFSKHLTQTMALVAIAAIALVVPAFADTVLRFEPAACSCESADLCKPISTGPRREVFVFGSKDWAHYDWSQVTTICHYGSAPPPPELVCLAHKHGARVSYLADFPKKNLTNSDDIDHWVKEQVQKIVENHLDGINIDFEDSIHPNEVQYRTGLQSLVAKTYKALKSVFPGYQITFDTPNNEDSTDRFFGYQEMVNNLDFFFIMAYDEWWDTVAGPNSGLAHNKRSIAGWLQIAPPSKLVLGLPWYGYDYPCVNLTSDGVCHTKKPGSGTEVNLSDIMKLLYSPAPVHIRMWDDSSATPYFNFKVDGHPHQMWYDDYVSLMPKYALAKDLRGVGMWEADALDYTNATQVAMVWDTLKPQK